LTFGLELQNKESVAIETAIHFCLSSIY